jgi:hypothetical protein
MRTRLLLAGLLVLCTAVPAVAQVPTVPAGIPFTVVIAHDGEDTTDYCVQVDALPEVCGGRGSVWANGVATLTHPGVAGGPHTLRAIARNCAPAAANTPCGEASIPLDFLATSKDPRPPTGVQLRVRTTALLTLPDGKTASLVLGDQAVDLDALIAQATAP